MARSRSIGNVYAELSLRDTKFQKGIKSATKALGKFGTMAAKGAAVAAAAMGAALVVGSKRAITMGADLDHLSTQTGVAVSSLMKLGQAYKDNGKDASGVAKDIGKMQKAIFTNATVPVASGSVDYFKEIGLSAVELMNLSPEEQFFKIGEAIKNIEDPTKRAAAAMGIFGKSGAGLITVFQGSNLDDVNSSLGKMPTLLEKYSAEFERADTLMGRIPNKWDQFFVGFSSTIISEVIPALESINDTDFTDVGTTVGEELLPAVREIAGIIEDVDFSALLSGITAVAMKAAEWAGMMGDVYNFARQIPGTPLWILDKITGGGELDAEDKEKARKQAESWGVDFDYVPTQSDQGKLDAAGKAADEVFAEAFKEQEAAGKAAEAAAAKASEAWEPPMFDMMDPENLPSVTDIIPEWLQRIPEGEKQESNNWEETSASVNSMQSRGLGMGSVMVPKEIKDQVSLLTQIRDVLKKTTNGGDPAFG